MTRFEAARAARRALDARLANVDVAAMRPPRGGWIRAVRTALGMSGAELGARMGVSRQAVAGMEARSQVGTVHMSTLAAAAAALDCRLVYAVVPISGSLEGIVLAEAGRIVDGWASSTAQSMALEGQAATLTTASRQDHVDDLLRSGRVWSTDATRG